MFFKKAVECLLGERPTNEKIAVKQTQLSDHKSTTYGTNINPYEGIACSGFDNDKSITLAAKNKKIASSINQVLRGHLNGLREIQATAPFTLTYRNEDIITVTACSEDQQETTISTLKRLRLISPDIAKETLQGQTESIKTFVQHP